MAVLHFAWLGYLACADDAFGRKQGFSELIEDASGAEVSLRTLPAWAPPQPLCASPRWRWQRPGAKASKKQYKRQRRPFSLRNACVPLACVHPDRVQIGVAGANRFVPTLRAFVAQNYSDPEAAALRGEIARQQFPPADVCANRPAHRLYAFERRRASPSADPAHEIVRPPLELAPFARTLSRLLSEASYLLPRGHTLLTPWLKGFSAAPRSTASHICAGSGAMRRGKGNVDERLKAGAHDSQPLSCGLLRALSSCDARRQNALEADGRAAADMSVPPRPACREGSGDAERRRLKAAVAPNTDAGAMKESFEEREQLLGNPVVEPPRRWAHRGKLFWVSQLASWLLRPGARVRARVERLRRQMQERAESRAAVDEEGAGGHAGDPGGVIAMRIGAVSDGCIVPRGEEPEEATGPVGRWLDWRRRPCAADGRRPELAAYMEWAELMRVRYGAHTILLVTDDARVAAEAPRQYPHFRWLVRPQRAAATAAEEGTSKGTTQSTKSTELLDVSAATATVLRCMQARRDWAADEAVLRSANADGAAKAAPAQSDAKHLSAAWAWAQTQARARARQECLRRHAARGATWARGASGSSQLARARAQMLKRNKAQATTNWFSLVHGAWRAFRSAVWRILPGGRGYARRVEAAEMQAAAHADEARAAGSRHDSSARAGQCEFEVVEGANFIRHAVPRARSAAGAEQSGLIYFREATTWQQCRTACAARYLCRSFTFIGGEYGGDADVTMRRTCFGAWEMPLDPQNPSLGEPGMVSGVKRCSKQAGLKPQPDFSLCGDEDGAELAEQELADIELLASADAYIGRFSAALDRLAFALMVARKHGCLPPYASLDSGWCFGEKSAQTLRGDRFDCTEFAA